MQLAMLSPKEFRGIHVQRSSDSADIVDRHVPLRTLHRAQVGPVKATGVRQGLLRQPAFGPKNTNVLRENLPEGAWMVPLHIADDIALVLLRRPLLRYIRRTFLPAKVC